MVLGRRTSIFFIFLKNQFLIKSELTHGSSFTKSYNSAIFVFYNLLNTLA